MFAGHDAAAHTGAEAGGGPAQWEPKKTWVFAVGVLVYPGGQAWPEEGRRDADLIGQLQARGVPADQITFIKDKDATLAAVRQSFDAVMAAASADTTLWLYFAGHGTRRETGVSEFMLYDAGWPVPDVFSTIERWFPGKTALLFADCCYSGSLVTDAMLRAGRVSYGAITSSLACTVSTGAWTFTECSDRRVARRDSAQRRRQRIDHLCGACTLCRAGDGLQRRTALDMCRGKRFRSRPRPGQRIAAGAPADR